MNCPFCGVRSGNNKSYPVCKHSLSVTTQIRELRGTCSNPMPVRYSCAFCSGRQVKEIVAFPGGLTEMIYDLDKHTATNQQWNKSIKIVQTVCNCCGFDLTKSDQLDFFEESESWLDQ